MAFDIDKWKSEAQEALTQLKADREMHTKQLDKVDAEIDKIETALGVKVEMPNGKGPKIMLRGPIKQVLIENPGGLTESALLDAVQAEKPDATPSSIQTAVKRLVRDDEKYVLEGGLYRHVAPAEVAAA